MKKVCCQAFGPPENLQRIEVDAPSPQANEALVDISAAGVGFVDGLMVQGLYQVKPPLPYYPGSEFAGVVSEVGENVTNVQPGDRVLGMASNGAYADIIAVAATTLVKIPANLSDAIAAGFYINYATALYGLRDCGHLKAGETLLILGAAGGVGSSAISVAKAMGARVIAAASSDEKRRAALSFGADHAVDYTDQNWRDALKQLTKGSGLNMVYDPVGGDKSEPAFRSLSPGGRFLVVGFAGGEIPKIPLNLPLLKRSSIVGVDWGGEFRANPRINQELMETLMGWTADGTLVPAEVVCRQMVDYQNALKDQLAGKIVGKLVLMN
jgi:NADPH2:quinone reductase|tara:strand:+ start:2571 stop:3545 length:975 start_codon:yes stop_codon:yes gene_type:complete